MMAWSPNWRSVFASDSRFEVTMPRSSNSDSNSGHWSDHTIVDPSIVVYLNGLARACLLIALVAAPWLFGGVHTHIQFVLYSIVLTSLSIWIVAALWLSVTRGIKTNRIPLIMIPLVGVVVLGNYQLSPEREQPTPQSVRTEISEAEATSENEEDRQHLGKEALIRSLKAGKSICPAFTRFEISRLMVVVAAFFLGTQLFVTRLSQRWLWGLLALNGTVLSFFGIAQSLNWNGKLFWTQVLRHGGNPFASFVNRNNAAGYLCLCLAAAVGFLVSTWSFSAPIDELADCASHAGSNSYLRRRMTLRDFIDKLSEATALQLFSATFLVFIVTGIIGSASRGGWLAAGFATVATILLTRKSYGLTIVGSVLAVGATCVLLICWTGLESRVGKRWGQVASIDVIASDGRWNHWRDAVNAFHDFPMTGTGFGTYQFAYLPYQTHPDLSHVRFYNADNQFVEWLVESGWVGISLVATIVVMFFATSLLLLKRLHLEPVGLVGVFAIVSQCVSAFFDFGPTMAANMLTIAVLFGSVAGRAAYLVGANRSGRRTWGLCTPALYPSLIIPVLGIGILVSNYAGMNNLYAASSAHFIVQTLPKLETPDELDTEAVEKLIERLSDAIQGYSDDPEVNKALAELWIYLFRLHEYEEAKQQFPDMDPRQLWERTHLSAYYHQINSWERSGQLERVEMFMENAAISSHLVPAHESLLKAEASCVLDPELDLPLAMLQFLDGSENCAGESHLRKAVLLRPVSSKTFFSVGQLAQFAGLQEFSWYCLKKSLVLSSEHLLEIHKSVSSEMTLSEEFEHVLPESGEIYVKLALAHNSNFSDGSQVEIAERAVQLLSTPAEGQKEADRLANLARAHYVLGDVDASIEEYRKALAMSPSQFDWRLELTTVLFEHKGILWAIREAETGAAVDPGNKRIQNLVHNLRQKADEDQSKASVKGKKRN